MGPITAVKRCLRQYATFTGRASRAEFWWFNGIVLVLLLAILFGGGALAGASLEANATVEDAQNAVLTVLVVGAVFSLSMALPTYAVMSRRLRDMNRSGWWAVLGLSSPIAGLLGLSGWIFGWLFLVPLVMALSASFPGTNRFGDPSLDERYRPAVRRTPEGDRLRQLAREVSGEVDPLDRLKPPRPGAADPVAAPDERQ
ncbi:DUF805 domain-containing protein [Demequina sediminicola]|uniref:DUF805 domain-containing protein n=1 Tax=Demequina sediminicola TaxID=1095026 RepID=UPI0007837D92|nr:DUF805 domain-containing protein [Demequina sediminicola]